jgi:hypothetical protein
MTSTTPNVYCPACGQQIPADAGFCRECGHHLPARNVAAAAEPDASSAPLEPATPLIPTLTPEPPAPMQSADASPPGRELDRRIVAIAAAAVLLVGGGIAAAVALSGGGSSSNSAKAAHAGTRSDAAAVAEATPAVTVALATPEATVETPTPDATVATPTPQPTVESDTSLTAQMRRLDGLMQLSEQGRAAAVEGNTAAAAASRSALLRQLQSLRADAADPLLRSAVDRFIVAIREALRQNHECGSRCSAADLARVARLKRDALSELNPLLRTYVGRTYRLEEI